MDISMETSNESDTDPTNADMSTELTPTIAPTSPGDKTTKEPSTSSTATSERQQQSEKEIGVTAASEIDTELNSETDRFKLPNSPSQVKSGNIEAAITHSKLPAAKDEQLDPINDCRQPGAKVAESDVKADKVQGLNDESRESFAFPKPKISPSRPQKKDCRSSTNSNDVSGSSSTVLGSASHRTQQEKSPAEKLVVGPPLPYKEPPWSGKPTEEYSLEVLKGGTIVDRISLNERTYHVFGRLGTCDVALEHPSLSRYHLVLQYRLTGDSEHDPGFYLYDLGSTHGSWFNKQQMKGRVYYRMRVGHMFKLGGSTRMYILQGPAEDQEGESELSVKELKELRQTQLAELEERKKKLSDESIEGEGSDDGGTSINWGMDEDANAVDATGDNPFAVMTQEEKEATYIKDPKKALRGYFEREGYELEYDVEEKENGFKKQFVCKIELPVDDANGRPIFAEAAIVGKKREAVEACALEACRILDEHGVLRQAAHESHKRKAKNWKDDDYYDSDDDTFLDRTGAVEKKRVLRMKKAGVVREKTHTYDTLRTELTDVEAEIKTVQNEIESTTKKNASMVASDDSLDAFMASIKQGKPLDRTWRAKLKLRLIDLRKEQARLRKLADIAKPAAMPTLQTSLAQSSHTAASRKVPLFGSMKGRGMSLKHKLMTSVSPTTVPITPCVTTTIQQTAGTTQEEEDDDDDVVLAQATPDLQPSTMNTVTPSPVMEEPRCTTTNVGTLISAAPEKDGIKQSPTSSEDQQSKTKPSSIVHLKEQRLTGMSRETPKTSPEGVKAATRRFLQEDSDDVSSSSSKKRPFLEPSQQPSKKREIDDNIEEEKDFASWVPPQGQTGDGRTLLNDKFGY